MDFSLQFPKLCHNETRRWLCLVAVVVVIHFCFLPSLLPDDEFPPHDRYILLIASSSAKSVMSHNPLMVNASDDLVMKNSRSFTAREEIRLNTREERNFKDVFISEGEGLESIETRQDHHFLGRKIDTKLGLPLQKLVSPKSGDIPQGNASSSSISDLKIELPSSNNNLTFWGDSGANEMRIVKPPKSVTSIHEMNHILERNLHSSRQMRPLRPSVRDREILAAKSKIENAPLAMDDRELYAPIFRNVSTFKRSYELMESTLKVYVYRDGKKPIFHQPILKGIYASEGWFMKLMEGNKHYVVKDPRKAHLFYMPFSSRMLEQKLYGGDYNNRTNLRQFLKDYWRTIAARYPYWNRTGGADHFLVACHDWAPYETRHHMDNCTRALCTADVNEGFKIGKDVSLPETSVRSKLNPLRDLGGKPPSQRHILAFFAGSMHGYLRPILIKHWKDKDPTMKISGPMPKGFESKMNYIEHMKSSKYCICPKGYEVNSPRVVEAIFYECVPVLISDNFVPPFFDFLNWRAFSVIVAEKDIPNLKEILLLIPEEKYLELQLGVRKVQKHFLWHAIPIKYDLFHMILHSIWHNRVFQTN